jgi:hypothetical protein
MEIHMTEEINSKFSEIKEDISNIKSTLKPIVTWISTKDTKLKHIDKDLLKDIYDNLINLDNKIQESFGSINEICEWLQSVENKIYMAFKYISDKSFKKEIRELAEEYEKIMENEEADEDEETEDNDDIEDDE